MVPLSLWARSADRTVGASKRGHSPSLSLCISICVTFTCTIDACVSVNVLYAYIRILCRSTFTRRGLETETVAARSGSQRGEEKGPGELFFGLIACRPSCVQSKTLGIQMGSGHAESSQKCGKYPTSTFLAQMGQHAATCGKLRASNTTMTTCVGSVAFL